MSQVSARGVQGLARAVVNLARRFARWIWRRKYVRLFRAVAPAELEDVARFGGFRPGPPSFQGKWFAERLDDAEAWGKSLQRLFGERHQIIQVDVLDSVAAEMYRLANLDGIGPARFADEELLAQINRTRPVVKQLGETGG